ncbi:PREDICTED: AP2-like ethylene-responsive transcription factor AIL6 isoform X2 [Nelumbo nucifera]|uniref:AP2-like ethylene-responsive transcription factor AIL6 isoform X2 n=2 Tax=Nelumbo nucifera TaxID=4432 RepID=A0A1U8QAA7_NELNU|nr:PREDICTED: AP2-like ethylene-responsive transcription factor AIL6 isoform X2 [Nelumbo nucifera]DAD22137.1 TPA_asm: hypothetical protein HUJ06_023600 [Nelumbo nucifera]
MAPAGNWLSSSVSPLEMLPSCQSSMSDSFHQHFFFDSFYGNDWASLKTQMPYTEEEEAKEVKDVKAHNAADTSMLASLNPQIQHTVPKLEDFLGGHSSSLARYSDSQTETQESSLTNVYEQGCSSLFADQHHHLTSMTATAGFQPAFSANSGSEVDDSVSVDETQLRDLAGHSLESGSEMVFSHAPPQSLSLAVAQSSEKAVVPVQLESSKKVTDTFGQRTSIYRGVTRHRWTGRYEAHLWDNSCRREGQTRKGRQGGYDREEKAARAYDLAALKYWGPTATINFPVSDYTKELEEMKNMSRQEFIASLRRKSSGFSRGASIYRGVTRHHQQGRWQARIGRVAGNKDLYLGTFGTEEEAAEAYDIAAIKFRGVNAVTNFEMSRYDIEAITNSALPIGAAAKRLKLSFETSADQSLDRNLHDRQPQSSSSSSSISSMSIVPAAQCAIPVDAPAGLYHQNLHHLHSGTGGSLDSSTSTSPLALLPPPPPPPCGRKFLYGLSAPIDINGHFNVTDNPPQLQAQAQAVVSQQPWNVASSSY